MNGNIGRLWAVLFRAALYFLLAVMPVVIAGIYDVLQGNAVASRTYQWWIGCSAFYQGIIALRAFYDGSAQRHADFLANGASAAPQPPPTPPSTETTVLPPKS